MQLFEMAALSIKCTFHTPNFLSIAKVMSRHSPSASPLTENEDTSSDSPEKTLDDVSRRIEKVSSLFGPNTDHWLQYILTGGVAMLGGWAVHEFAIRDRITPPSTLVPVTIPSNIVSQSSQVPIVNLQHQQQHQQHNLMLSSTEITQPNEARIITIARSQVTDASQAQQLNPQNQLHLAQHNSTSTSSNFQRHDLSQHSQQAYCTSSPSTGVREISYSSTSAPITWSVRTALTRIDVDDLEGLPHNEPLLHLFQQLADFKTIEAMTAVATSSDASSHPQTHPTANIEERHALSQAISSAFRKAVVETDALCFLQVQMQSHRILPSKHVADKARMHMISAVEFLLDMVVGWRVYERPQIEAQKLVKLRKSERQIKRRDAILSGEYQDDALFNDEDDGSDSSGVDSDSDMYCDKRTLQDPRRTQLYREWEPFVDTSAKKSQQRAQIRRRCRDRLRWQIVDCEREKIQFALKKMFTDIRNWSVSTNKQKNT